MKGTYKNVMYVGTMVRSFNFCLYFCGKLPQFIICYNCANRAADMKLRKKKKEYILELGAHVSFSWEREPIIEEKNSQTQRSAFCAL
jgi:hypothetical protein